ncbi:hypothetical protein EVAR_70018_1 [Eumeta japonica]|uniref:Uncharacterized protein n=1 Tax=Eumeta variegata TaxID=151549 RepID=A0A4C2AIQ7_EUMVA|nr:hypothetical protein EVAR_70018_1 [Eumeta japonica]
MYKPISYKLEIVVLGCPDPGGAAPEAPFVCVSSRAAAARGDAVRLAQVLVVRVTSSPPASPRARLRESSFEEMFARDTGRVETLMRNCGGRVAGGARAATQDAENA